jgi:hypothetical protein
MKFIIFTGLIAALCNAVVMSASAQERRFEPRKYDEYSKCGRTASSSCENDESEWARLDSVGNLLKSDLSANAYLIGYSGSDSPFGSGIVHANYARNLLRRWVADDTRVRAIYGGRRENLTIEVWIVSDYLSVPPPTPTISDQSISAAQKYYEYQHPYVGRTALELFSEYEYFNRPAILDGLAAQLEREPNSRTHIIAYDGLRDRRGAANKVAQGDRYYLAMESNISAERIVIVNGGRRESREVELWVVPQGAAVPKPTPDTKKTNRRR